ncbi:hypothetical protein L6452_42647 [Arctium lappa]|uniref:Uncharacterized protein n=1 Tax=Arctium lappa TaxID=4217 RepID=A0ACB8XJZ0_ARCLA|nr:hypothetical protein L6452_42647 [Arctium lappa]
MDSASYWSDRSSRSKKKAMKPPKRGQIKRKIVAQIVNSAVSFASMATSRMMKNKGGGKEADSSSTCTSVPLTPSNSGRNSDGISDSDRSDFEVAEPGAEPCSVNSKNAT